MLKNIEKIVLFDYKLALVDEENWKMPQRTWETILKIKESGWGVGVMSSSPYRQLVIDFGQEKLNQFDFVATHNGARIDFDGKTYEVKIPLGEVDQIFDLDNYITSFSIGEMMYMDSHEKLLEYAKKYKFKNYKVVDEIDEDVLAARLIFETREDRDQKYPDLYKKYCNKFNIEEVDDVWVLLTVKEATRVNAMKNYLIDKEIIYVGGEMADVEVFKSRIFNMKRVCLSDALDEVRELADVVLEDNHNDGIKFEVESI